MIQPLKFGCLASSGPGAVIQLAPGIEAVFARGGASLDGTGYLIFLGEGPGGFVTFRAEPQRSSLALFGPGWQIQLCGVELPQITRAVGSTPGKVFIPVTHCLVWRGGWPPSPGACSSMQIQHVSYLDRWAGVGVGSGVT
jgi:hypothetical protein